MHTAALLGTTTLSMPPAGITMVPIERRDAGASYGAPPAPPGIAMALGGVLLAKVLNLLLASDITGGATFTLSISTFFHPLPSPVCCMTAARC
jgi:hypothetical protein